MDPAHDSGRPFPWIARFAPLVPQGAAVLDLACGAGRHTRLFLELGHPVTAVDLDASGLDDLRQHPHLEIVQADLEDGSPWPLPGRRFGAVVVTNYLWRPLFEPIVEAVQEDGLLLYETFARGNEAYGRPTNPDFLLYPGELIEAVRGRLQIVAYEHGYLDHPRPAVKQRLCAARTDQPLPLWPASAAGTRRALRAGPRGDLPRLVSVCGGRANGSHGKTGLRGSALRMERRTGPSVGALPIRGDALSGSGGVMRQEKTTALPREMAPAASLAGFLACHCLAGVIAGWIMVGGLLWLDVAGLGGLVMASDLFPVPLLMLLAAFALTFGAVAMGSAIMGLGRSGGSAGVAGRKCLIPAPPGSSVPGLIRAALRRL